jgi:hypothetical protein
MLAARSAIATPAPATLMLVLAAAVEIVIVLLVALGAILIATLGPVLLRLGPRRSRSRGRLGGSGHKSGRVIGALSWFWRRWRLGAGRFRIGWLAHTRSGDRFGAHPFIGSVTIGIGFALLLLTAKGARPTAATMGTSTFVHAPVLVCGRASTAQ